MVITDLPIRIQYSKYVDIRDPQFRQFIDKKYHQFKIPKKPKTFKEICFPKKYEFQIPQLFLAKYINPQTPYHGILVYHKIGAGKTCAAISIGENFKGIKRILVVLPASLKGNFRSELRSLCTGEKYLKNSEREILKKLQPNDPEYKKIIAKSDERINKNYTIYSYNKFIDLLKNNKLSLTNTLLIIDEIHNMVSENGTYYKYLYHAIHTAPKDLKVVILSATPIFDKPIEIALTMNLLLRDDQLPVGADFYQEFIDVHETNHGPLYKVKNMDFFKRKIKGYVSYYRGAPPQAFPQVELSLTKCMMSEFQFKLYSSVNRNEFGKEKKILDDYLDVNIPNSFFIGTRMISNIAFPNKKIGKKGYESLNESDFELETLEKYSPKFVKLFRRIRRSQGTIFIYSGFKNYGGIKTFVRFLEHNGYVNFKTHGPGKKRYGTWTGDENIIYKENLKTVFNQKENEDGSKIKIILGSSSAKEGVSFLRVQQVHIMEPYWNWSRLDQVMGRAIRYCSHKDLPEERRIVKVYIYLAIHPKIPQSVDQKIMEMAMQKKYINNQFELSMKEASVDCDLFKYGNEPEIVCDKS
jgi:hypothetical protein